MKIPKILTMPAPPELPGLTDAEKAEVDAFARELATSVSGATAEQAIQALMEYIYLLKAEALMYRKAYEALNDEQSNTNAPKDEK